LAKLPKEYSISLKLEEYHLTMKGEAPSPGRTSLLGPQHILLALAFNPAKFDSRMVPGVQLRFDGIFFFFLVYSVLEGFFLLNFHPSYFIPSGFCL
jgi:hypothetical protein